MNDTCAQVPLERNISYHLSLPNFPFQIQSKFHSFVDVKPRVMEFLLLALEPTKINDILKMSI